MLTCYVSGKYSPTEGGVESMGEIEENIARAASYALELWLLGFAVFCPHMNTANFEDLVPYDDLLMGDLRFVELMDTMFMVPGWEESAGATKERKYARAMKKPIFYNLDEARTWLGGHYESP